MFFVKKARAWSNLYLAGTAIVSLALIGFAVWTHDIQIFLVVFDVLAFLAAVAGLTVSLLNMQMIKKVNQGVLNNNRSIFNRWLRKAAEDLKSKYAKGNPGDDQLRHLSQVIVVALEAGPFSPEDIRQCLSDIIRVTIKYEVNYSEAEGKKAFGALIVSVGGKSHRTTVWAQ